MFWAKIKQNECTAIYPQRDILCSTRDNEEGKNMQNFLKLENVVNSNEM